MCRASSQTGRACSGAIQVWALKCSILCIATKLLRHDILELVKSVKATQLFIWLCFCFLCHEIQPLSRLVGSKVKEIFWYRHEFLVRPSGSSSCFLTRHVSQHHVKQTNGTYGQNIRVLISGYLDVQDITFSCDSQCIYSCWGASFANSMCMWICQLYVGLYPSSALRMH